MRYTNYCSRCKAAGTPLLKYSKTQTTQYHLCRSCQSKRQKKYHETQRGRLAINKANRRTYAKHPEKHAARKQVAMAIKEKNMKRPPLCELCGRAGRIEGHHMDYDHPLEVLWLCTSCHASFHKLK